MLLLDFIASILTASSSDRQKVLKQLQKLLNNLSNPQEKTIISLYMDIFNP